MIENGITYVNYDEEAINAFMDKTRVKKLKLKRQLTVQLSTAEKRRFSATKVPLPLLRELLAMLG